METITATRARGDLFNLIKESLRAHKQHRISSKEGSVVMLSEDDYENLIETLELLSTPDFLKSIRKAKKEIREGKTYSMKDVFGDE